MIEVGAYSVYVSTDEEAAAIQMAVSELTRRDTETSYEYRFTLPTYQMLTKEQREILYAVARLYNENQ